LPTSSGSGGVKYLALGDSYTIGTGASDAAHAWPSIIAARLGAELTNPAVNGYTTEDLIRDELPVFRALKPHVISVLIGVNDLVQGRSPEAYRASLRAIYQEIGAGADVFAVSIPTWSYAPAAAEFGGAAHVERMTGIFNAIAREEASVAGYTWIDLGPVSTSQIGRRGWLASDQLHPGDAQYAAWAEVIWPEVRERVR
jgi:lysophospholipase L1-like esterase